MLNENSSRKETHEAKLSIAKAGSSQASSTIIIAFMQVAVKKQALNDSCIFSTMATTMLPFVGFQGLSITGVHPISSTNTCF